MKTIKAVNFIIVARQVLLISFLVFSSSLSGATYYVSPTGSDSNPGTIANPWGTWQKAFSTAIAGDIVYFRGGVWYPTSASHGDNITMIAPHESLPIGHDGTPGNIITYENYPGEVPILDAINLTPKGGYNTGLNILRADYIKFKGLTFRNILQTRDYVECFGIGASECTNLTFENITIHNVDGNAFRSLGAWMLYPEHKNYPSNHMYWINCDAHDCCDARPRVAPPASPHLGGAADGFKIFDEPGAYIHLIGCRAWKCSDDGFDPAGSAYIELKNCWSFENGALNGDGNGFKNGGVGAATVNVDADPNNNFVPDPNFIYEEITGCIAANNNHISTADGFFLLEYAGYYRTNARYYNNFSYNNNIGFTVSPNAAYPNPIAHWRNNISYKNSGGSWVTAAMNYTESNNTWDGTNIYPCYREAYTLTDADFTSLDVTQLSRARKGDGSLPDIDFGHLVPGSRLIDAGTNVGLPYFGSAPDIGAFETINSASAAQPQYLSSIVEDPVPSLIEMNYNLNLANIVPSKSAFEVLVNSVIRTVSSVAIAGTKVKLTLASAVAQGDVVTIAYTKPTTNPLETSAGVQAESLPAHLVTNNIDNVITQVKKDVMGLKISIYPNPAHELINISLEEPSLVSYIIRITSLSGKVFFEDKLETGSQNVAVPLKLNPGLYFVQLLSGGIYLPTHKLIIY